jgi:hypothetical protein
MRQSHDFSLKEGTDLRFQGSVLLHPITELN